MGKSKFDVFKDYIFRVNRITYSVIDIFQRLHRLKEEIQDDLIHSKPKFNEYEYQALLESYLHDLNKLDYPKEVDYSKINHWLVEHDTTKEEFLQWHIENPNASYWETKDAPNNILFEILYTQLNFNPNLTYPLDVKSTHLETFPISKLQLIQHNFEYLIKNVIVNDLSDFLKNQQNLFTKSNLNQSQKTYNWFKVGILFATGEIDSLRNEFSQSFTKIAKDKFGKNHTSYRPYISESYNNSTQSAKNIFADDKKILKIYDYCMTNNITITEDFIKLIKSIKAH